ncbi:MAG: PEGA domain-containing protein [Acidobacteriota bacterium]
MKKYFLLAMTLLISFVFYSCSDNSTNPTPAAQKGSIVITSNPSGAQIWNNNTNTNKVTPDSLTGLDAGNYSITLKYQGLRDTTISVTVKAGEAAKLNVRLPLSTVTFGPVRLYETIGTTATQPSGLILSTGQPSGIGSTATDRAKVDLYYSSNGFVLASADQASGLTRVTYFKVGSSTNLTDTVAAPAQDQSWVKSVKDTENNYIFVYDNDKHYSKIQITNRGGGTPGTPAWVDVKVIYNQQAGDRRF